MQYLLLFFYFSFSLMGQELGVVVTEIKPQPELSILRKWMQQIHDTDEIWYFHDQKSLNQILEDLAISPDVQYKIKNNLVSYLDNDIVQKADEFYNINEDNFIPGKSRILKIDKKLAPYITQEMRQQFFNHQRQYFNSEAYNKVKIGPLLEGQLSKLPPEDIEILRRHIIYRGSNSPYLLLNPEVWEKLPVTQRKEILKKNLNKNTVETYQGLKVSLNLYNENHLDEILEKYVPLENRENIRKILLDKTKKGFPVKINLEEILTNFQKSLVNSYVPCHGPNCFNTAINHYETEHATLKFTDVEELNKKLYSEFRLVQPNEKLMPGDILVYRTLDGEPVHVSLVIGEEFVFTKNGLDRRSPYVIQMRKFNEGIYESDFDGFEVYRKPRNGEKVVNAFKKESLTPKFYWTKNVIDIKAHQLLKCLNSELTKLIN